MYNGFKHVFLLYWFWFIGAQILSLLPLSLNCYCFFLLWVLFFLNDAFLLSTLDLLTTHAECPYVYIDTETLITCRLLEKHKYCVIELHEHYDTYISKRDLTVEVSFLLLVYQCMYLICGNTMCIYLLCRYVLLRFFLSIYSTAAE